jgi:predicted SnoaL-like aldol condensation-catalyzing enzyme
MEAQSHPQATKTESSVERHNKEVAKSFYEDLWFSRNTDRYVRYFNDTYVVHDTGVRKGVVEPAVNQKTIADSFWKHGELGGEIDFQIADGDLVATRWRARMKPRTMRGRLLSPKKDLPIINVFRFEHGKIVEIWNHRHDIDTGQTIRFKAQGVAVGLLVALIPLVVKWLRRR